MANKYLHDLLREDQEPFFLKNFISDKQIQLKEKNPIKKSQFSLSNNRKNPKKSCFYSFNSSPEITNSPLNEILSPVSIPCEKSNSIQLRIPANTAALLFEAASRILTREKKKSRITSNLGLFESVLKKLRNKNGSSKREIGNGGVIRVKELIDFELGFSDFACNGKNENDGAVWLVGNGEVKCVASKVSPRKSLDSGDPLFISENRKSRDFVSSPSLRFSLDANCSSGFCTPELSSPTNSPERINIEDGQNQEEEMEVKFQVDQDNAVEKKEQFSPVSVLDSPHEEDDEIHEDYEEDDDDEDDDEDKNGGGFDLESSYAFVQRAKKRLLQKLRRFEQLAELDSLELDKQLLESDQDDDANQEDVEEDDKQLMSAYKSNNDNPCTIRVINKLRLKSTRCIDTDTKNLMSGLPSNTKKSVFDTISDMIITMVKVDFGGEHYGPKKNDQEQVRSIANDMEFVIFEMLINELLDELIY